jgi:F-type H+-transporting ATPase subunit b
MNLLILAAEGAEHANGFLLGELKETIVSGIASVILFSLLWWKTAPLAKKALGDRTARIAKELEDAEKARVDAETKLSDVQGRIANAEQERQRILVEARQTAEALKNQIVAKAEEEAVTIKSRAVADLEASKGQAVADLQSEVAALAMGAAEAIIAKALDAQTQTDLIDGYISQVGASK